MLPISPPCFYFIQDLVRNYLVKNGQRAKKSASQRGLHVCTRGSRGSWPSTRRKEAGTEPAGGRGRGLSCTPGGLPGRSGLHRDLKPEGGHTRVWTQNIQESELPVQAPNGDKLWPVATGSLWQRVTQAGRTGPVMGSPFLGR